MQNNTQSTGVLDIFWSLMKDCLCSQERETDDHEIDFQPQEGNHTDRSQMEDGYDDKTKSHVAISIKKPTALTQNYNSDKDSMKNDYMNDDELDVKRKKNVDELQRKHDHLYDSNIKLLREKLNNESGCYAQSGHQISTTQNRAWWGRTPTDTEIAIEENRTKASIASCLGKENRTHNQNAKKKIPARVDKVLKDAKKVIDRF